MNIVPAMYLFSGSVLGPFYIFLVVKVINVCFFVFSKAYFHFQKVWIWILYAIDFTNLSI